ncbi:hypothetical protein [Bradyrhizobium japonicum]|uniref:hypothetical protein n=1 Tax=Bradyrhizobium japonicum TaxID=375 RepID=UPI001BA6831C|nr:hypothetical protein [Bradyrhizobium japonicum]MBR0958194.1 hypothetical protein [Bradyrhizobium japonicum]
MRGCNFQRALTLTSLVLRRRVSAISKDEACAQASYAIAGAVEIAIQLEDANELRLSADAVAPSSALDIRITPSDAVWVTSPILPR